MSNDNNCNGNETKCVRGEIKVNELPVEMSGPVITGFGRGSKQLGCPTANIPIERHSEVLEAIPIGVYYALATLPTVDKADENGRFPVYKAAMSIGWNPFFNNSKKTIEAHLLHEFSSDFYNEQLRILVIGYIRPMENYSSLEMLKEAIQADIDFSNEQLSASCNSAFFNSDFLHKPIQ